MDDGHVESLNFTYDVPSSRVVFGAGARRSISDEIGRLTLMRVLVIATAGRSGSANEIASYLGHRCAAVFPRARQHVPRDGLEEARALAASEGVDGYVTVGGGSAVGYGKGLALESGLPIVALPTTYAGSEVTPIWGISDGNRKNTGRSSQVLPRTVLYDPELTLDFPPALAGASGMNAIAHCIEALYAKDCSPVTALFATEGLRVLSGALRAIAANPADVRARADALYGSYLGGMALAGASMGIHHRLCHLLGGAFGLPHAETHAILLPHIVAYKAGTEGVTVAARVLRTGDTALALHELRASTGAPAALRDIGLTEEALARAVHMASDVTDDHGKPSSDALHNILHDAFHGRPPRTAA